MLYYFALVHLVKLVWEHLRIPYIRLEKYNHKINMEIVIMIRLILKNGLSSTFYCIIDLTWNTNFLSRLKLQLHPLRRPVNSKNIRTKPD